MDRTEANSQRVGRVLEKQLGCKVEITEAGTLHGLVFRPMKDSVGELRITAEVLSDTGHDDLANQLGVVTPYLLGGTSGAIRHTEDGDLEFVRNK